MTLKKVLIAFLLVASFFLIVSYAKAAPVSWDGNVSTGVLQPLQSLWGSTVKFANFVASSTNVASSVTYRLGLGTAAPTALLDVNGASIFRGVPTFQDVSPTLITAVVGSAGYIVQSNIDGTGLGGQNVFQRSGGTTAVPTATLTSMGLGSLSFRGYTGSGYTGSKVFVSGVATQDWSTTANGTRLAISTTPNDSTTLTTRFVIDQSGFIGIGSGTAPSSLFHISSAPSSVSWGARGIFFATEAQTATDTTGVGAVTLRAANSFGVPTFASTNAVTVTNAANLYIAGAPVAGTNMTITNGHALYVNSGIGYFGGNVGINSTVPYTFLTINASTTASSTGSQIRLQSAVASITTGLIIGGVDFISRDSQITDPGGLRSGNITVEANRAHTSTVVDSDMVFRTVGGVGIELQEKMRLAASGVGIGTSTPFGSFGLQAFSSINRLLSFTDSTGAEIASMTSTGELGLGTTTSATSNFGLAATTGTAAGNNGDNVARLIHSAASQTGAGLVLGSVRAANSAFNHLSVIADYDGTPVEQVTIRGDGNMGVGSTTPSSKFSVLNTLGGTTPLFTVASSTAGAATSSAIYVRSDGGVGINSNTPRALTSAALTVGGNQSGNAAVEFAMGSAATIQCFNTSSAYCALTFDGSTSSFRSNATSGTFQTFRAITTTLAGATVGANFDYTTAVTNAAQNFSGITLSTAAVTAANTNTLRGMTISPGAITNAAGATTYIGALITMPAITQSAGTLTSTGLRINGGTVTSGTAYALITDIAAGSIGFGTTTPTARLTLASSTTAISGLNLDYGATPTTLRIGDIWGEVTTLMFSWFDGISHYFASNTYSALADKTINTISDVSAFNATNGTGYVGTTTIPANYMKVGKKFTITGWGVYSTPALNTSTVTIKIKYGATTVATVTTNALPAAATNLPFDFIADCTVRSVGATGTIVCNGMFNYATALTAAAATSNALVSGVVTIDTTAQSNIDVTGAWSAVTTETATVQQSSIDFKN